MLGFWGFFSFDLTTMPMVKVAGHLIESLILRHINFQRINYIIIAICVIFDAKEFDGSGFRPL
jgi:hypothetical protein